MKNNKSLGQHWLKNRQILDHIAALATDPVERELYFPAEDLAHPACLSDKGHNDMPVPPFGKDHIKTPASTSLSSRHKEDLLEYIPSTASPEVCLEIGPGLGTLTSALLRRFPEVVAVEYDERLAHNLPASFPGKNLTVIHQDFLKFDLNTLPRPYAVAANIPYYITSPIISKLLSLSTPSQNLPSTIVLLIQKEVAERIAAEPGRHTVLSLQVQNRARVALGPVVPRTEFTPPPQVDSRIIILEPCPAPIVEDKVFKLIKQGFSSPRKKLIKNLPISNDKLISIFQKLNISPDARPAELSLYDWGRLYQVFYHDE